MTVSRTTRAKKLRMVRFSNVVDLLASPAARAWQMILCFNPGRGELQSCDSKLKKLDNKAPCRQRRTFQESCGLGERYKSKDPPDGQRAFLPCKTLFLILPVVGRMSRQAHHLSDGIGLAALRVVARWSVVCRRSALGRARARLTSRDMVPIYKWKQSSVRRAMSIRALRRKRDESAATCARDQADRSE